MACWIPDSAYGQECRKRAAVLLCYPRRWERGPTGLLDNGAMTNGYMNSEVEQQSLLHSVQFKIELPQVPRVLPRQCLYAIAGLKQLLD